MERSDVIVVGAGVSGLIAAERLVRAGRSVLVIEAKPRVGGRTWTDRVHGVQIERGGQWIGPGQPRMAALVKELGLSLDPTPVGGAQVLERAGKLRTYTGTIPPVGVLNLIQLQATLSLVEHMRRRVPADAPWTAARAERWDGQTVASFADRIPSPVVRDILLPAVRTVFGADPGELSLLHFLAYVSSADGFMRLMDVDGGFQQDRIREGMQSVSERLADRVGRDAVRLGHPVRRVAQDGVGVTVQADGLTARADRVIIAVPPALLDRVAFEPLLPAARATLHQRAVMGATVKIFVGYERPFWRESGLSGEVVCSDGPISVVFDNTNAAGAPMLLCFIVGRPARGWSERPAAERRGLVLSALTRWLGPEAASPAWMEEMDWSTVAWTEGCPISVLPTGTTTIVGDAIRAPVGRVHWASTETARACTGFVEGAVEAGERAAEEILQRG